MDKVMGIVLFISFMVFLFKFTTISRWWLWFFIIMGLLAKAGFALGMVGTIVAFAIWKVITDIFTGVNKT